MISENDIKKHIPVVIDTYSELFGEEYRKIITERLNNLNYFVYNNITDFKKYSDNISGFEYYYNFLLRCKQKELSLKFLDLIGIDISKNNGKSFADDLDEDIYALIVKYIGDYTLGLGFMGSFNNYGVLAFKPENSDSKQNRVDFLNFIRNSSKVPLTVNTLDVFYQTEEYKKIKVKIDLAIEAYDKILSEYKLYKESLEPFNKEINESKTLRDNMKKSRLNDFISASYVIFPLEMKSYLESHKLSAHDIFDIDSLSEKSNIEFFSEADNLKLKDPDENENGKNTIRNFRMKYFSSLGFDVDIKSDTYEDIIKNPDVNKLIPSEKLVERIIKRKDEELLKVKHDLYYTIYDFKSCPVLNEKIYNNIINNIIGITTSFPLDLSNFHSTLFFTYRNGDEGIIDFSLLHEFCHQIELFMSGKKLMSGFDINYELDNIQLNPYNKEKRKYERFNENITDIFSIEALNIMRNKRIYILEKPKLSKDIQLVEKPNTSPITRQLLIPFVNKYRKQIIKARILGASDELFTQIGQENFEELNDSMNKLDYLLDIKHLNNVLSFSQIDLENTDDLELLEIAEQIKRVNQIYVNMENYRTDKEESDNNVKPKSKDLLGFIDEELER